MSNKVFVFGSNTEGRHGAGAALFARKERGAIYGQARGLQGDSYGIVTVELREGKPDPTLPQIRAEVLEFLQFAKEHPEMRFEVTPIGCGIAGFVPEQIAPMFKGAPANVELPEVFKKLVNI